jgi:polyhydroxybutyrate depolymerase
VGAIFTRLLGLTSRRLLVLALALGAVLAATVPAAGTQDGRAAAPAGCSRPAQRFTTRLTVDGQSRSALVYVPASAAGRTLPLLLAFHGAGGKGPWMEDYSGFSSLADRGGFMVAYPSAREPRRVWNLTEEETDDDVVFTDALISRLRSGGCVDASRIYAVGVSNGAGFVARLACESSARLAAIVTVAGGYGHLPPCEAQRPLSVLEIHGTKDRVVPYAGKPQDGYVGSVRKWLRGWTERDGCLERPRRRVVAPATARLDWERCRAGTEVSHLELYGAGHIWPGADPPEHGTPNPISAAREALRFLDGRRLAPENGG